MDFPHGHHHHRPGHYRPDEESYPPPNQHYPPSSFDEPPPPPQVTHVGHSSPYNEFGGGRDSYRPPPPPHAVDYGYGPPPPPADDYGYGPPPPPAVDYGYGPPPPAANSGGYSSVEHVSHQSPPPPPAVDYGYAPPPPSAANSGGYSSVEHVSHQSHRPHLPSFVHHHSHSSPEISNKRSVRVYTKAEPNFSLTIRDGKVILARSDPSDPYQHWIKEEKFSTKVKDEQGFPSFALINKATGQALKHSTGATHPVQLIPYNPNVLDESILWTESKDLGDTYRTVRMVNNIRLNVDALNGDQNHGGVHDGTKIVLWEWKKGDNQRWKIVPYCKSSIFKSWHFPFIASPPCSIRTLKKYELPCYFCSFNASDDTCRMSACLAKKLLYGYGAVFLICKSGCLFFLRIVCYL